MQTEGIMMTSPNGHHTWCANEDHANWLERKGWTRIGFMTYAQVRKLEQQGIKIQRQF